MTILETLPAETLAPSMRIAAIAWHSHHLEHLIPLCELLDATLITLNRETAEVAKACYPFSSLVEVESSPAYATSPLSDPNVRRILGPFDVFLYSNLLFRKELRKLFGKLKNPPPRVIYCPHGFSEKRQTWSATSAYQDISVFYGQAGLDQLENWGVKEFLGQHIVSGNYRVPYYQKHQDYFRSLLESRGIRKSGTKERTVLYAPTWFDALKSSSFLDAVGHLIDGKPSDTRLLIKPHPLMELHIAETFQKLIANNPDILLLRNLPVTFPLLEAADAYIGDMSSLAYDFLYFDRPMVFLNQTAGDVGDAQESRLFKCGSVVEPQEYRQIYRALDKEEEVFKSRADVKRGLYAYVYGPDKPEKELAEELAASVQGSAPAWMYPTDSSSA